MNSVPDKFHLVASYELALPYQAWRVSAHVMMARKLRLAEETVLSLVDAGVKNPKELSQLMGLSDMRMIQHVVITLMSKGLIGDNLGLYLTDLGRSALSHDRIKSVEVISDIPIRYDPYEDSFRYAKFKNDNIVKPVKQGLHMIPLPSKLESSEVESRYTEIQKLINENSSEINAVTDRKRVQQLEKLRKAEEEGNSSVERVSFSFIDGVADVLKLDAVEGEILYLPAVLNVYQDMDEKEWHWEVTRGGVRDDAIVERLRQLEREGVNIIPLESKPEFVETEAAADLHAVASAVVNDIVEATKNEPLVSERTVRPLVEVLSVEKHREALLQAIRDVRQCLIIISPWMRKASVNNEFLDALSNAMKSYQNLKIFIGFGIEPLEQRKPGHAKDSEDHALSRLKRLERKFTNQLSLVEVGNTHEKIVVCDDRYAIVTSFNFLSFNPNPDKFVRRETGIRTSEREAVKSLLETSLNILSESDKNRP